MNQREIKILHISKDMVGGIGSILKSSKLFFKSCVFLNLDMGYQIFFRETNKKINLVDIVHFHGAWTLHLLPAIYIHNIPIVISPHGALDRTSLSKSKIKKSIIKYLYMGKAYTNASCIHALTTKEAQDIRKYGITNVPIAVIPNGIDMQEHLNINNLLKRELLKKANGRRIILSLSRLHVSKGIDILIDAVYNLHVSNKDFVLFIVGSGDQKYEKHLTKKINQNKLNECVFLLGEMTGDNKTTVYDIADVFILPSFNEGFGLTVIEAYRQKLPVITTTATPFDEINRIGCGWFIKPTTADILNSLRDFMQTDQEQLLQMGIKGYDWISTSYSIENTAKKMENLYEWLLGKNEKPSFIIESEV